MIWRGKIIHVSYAANDEDRTVQIKVIQIILLHVRNIMLVISQ
jgi:hypothetical protein